MLTLREKGYIKRLPQITSEQINDQSKSDIFTKLITSIQVFSVIIQVIVRHSRNLEISQLELAVTAFSVCAVSTYLLTLYQPKNVQTIRILYNDDRDLSFDEAYRICVAERGISVNDRSYFLQGGVHEGVPNDDTYPIGPPPKVLYPALLMLPGGVIFGAVHCFGWSFVFPTEQEQLIWRIASVFTTSAPVALIVLFWIDWNKDGLPYEISLVTIIVSGFFYIIARLFIIVEVFRSLFYLSPDVFISTWADNIPHVS